MWQLHADVSRRWEEDTNFLHRSMLEYLGQEGIKSSKPSTLIDCMSKMFSELLIIIMVGILFMDINFFICAGKWT